MLYRLTLILIISISFDFCTKNNKPCSIVSQNTDSLTIQLDTIPSLEMKFSPTDVTKLWIRNFNGLVTEINLTTLEKRELDKTTNFNAVSFKNNDTIRIKPFNNGIDISYKNQIQSLYFYGNDYNNWHINSPYLVSHIKDSIYYYNVDTRQLKTIDFYLPLNHNPQLINDISSSYYAKKGLGYYADIPESESPKFSFNENGICVFRENQLHFVDVNAKKNYTYPVLSKQLLKYCLMDACNVYILYEHALIIEKKEKFLAKCTLFDPTKYRNQIKEFVEFTDDLLYFKDTSVYSVIIKLNTINRRYTETNLPEIIEKIKKVNISAFADVKIDKKSCYLNDQIPFEFRKNCLLDLIRENVNNGLFKEAIYYQDEYYKYFGDNVVFGSGTYSTMNAVRKYNMFCDSLDKTATKIDEKAFKKAMESFEVCKTSWFESASMYDNTVAFNMLKKFKKTYPQSEYIDDVDFQLLESYPGDESGEHYPLIVADLKRFMKKYPKSNQVPNAEFAIFYCSQTFEKDTNKLIKMGKDLLIKYPKNERIEEIKNSLRNLQ